ncbi:MAG: tRNA (adenosine(37)-N6)-threonylcarbamoyltransferase complex dimerization subunit type 1 TsaB [Bacilli bacterium]|nr:tRNA (adenosine(37)-N6)-threonylcarbamoyltransferase complex dimerization subunit type 1 TsaB [Bacilli bacterium]
MKYLFIDSATATLVVAIVINDKIAYIYNKEAGKDMSNVIMPTIEEAFKQSKILPKDIDKIFVSTGPGSFTGIRVGLTVAKTMAWSLNIPIVPISSLEVIASTPNQTNNIALIDARRGYVFAGIYDTELNVIKEDKHILLDNLNAEGTYVSYDSFDGLTPHIDILKVIKKHESEPGENPHTVNPKYLKLTEAEENLNKKNDNTTK